MKQQLYINILEDIANRIKTGEFKPGDKIPPERELGAYYNTSKSTIIKALRELIKMKYLTAVERVGYFVAIPQANTYKFSYDFPVAHGNTRITSEERPTPRKKIIPSADGTKMLESMMFCFISKCSRTVVKYRKMYVFFKRGIFMNTTKSNKQYWDMVLNQVMKINHSTKLKLEAVIPEGDLAIELETKIPTLYFKITRWDYDEYDKEMTYSETYIKADSFSLRAQKI